MLDQFLAIALKVGLLISVAGIFMTMFSRTSAAIRHFIWVSALALGLLLPFATALMPSYAIAPSPWQPAEQPVSYGSGTGQPQAETIPADFENSVVRLWPTASFALCAVWMLGVLFFLLRELVGHARLWWWSRRAHPLHSPHWKASLRLLNGALGLRVLESFDVTSPCTWGFVKPVLVLPAAVEGWNEEQRRCALVHELEHIRRRDYSSAAIARVACAVHWYNPLIWYAARQIRELQECACDDAVLRAGGVASQYAQLLVDLAARSTVAHGPLRPALGVAPQSPLRDRVVAILDPLRTRSEQSRIAAMVTVVPLACVMALLAGATLARSDEAPPARPISMYTSRPAAAISEPQPVKVRHAQRHHAHRVRSATAQLTALAPLPTVPALPVVRALPPIAAIPPTPLTKPVPPLPPEKQ
jgi:beta-lactamase regulating signal transducer with metallopeptidase domain